MLTDPEFQLMSSGKTTYDVIPTGVQEMWREGSEYDDDHTDWSEDGLM
jgi:hypothetical protein